MLRIHCLCSEAQAQLKELFIWILGSANTTGLVLTRLLFRPTGSAYQLSESFPIIGKAGNADTHFGIAVVENRIQWNGIEKLEDPLCDHGCSIGPVHGIANANAPFSKCPATCRSRLANSRRREAANNACESKG